MQTDTPHDSTESLDRLVLLLAAQPRPGWEGIFEEVSRREVERLAPHPRKIESPAADPSERGKADGNQAEGASADEAILH